MWKATTQFVAFYDCFAHINRSQFGVQSFKGKCINILWEDKDIILWCVETNTSEGCIGLNSLFAQRLGLSEGTAVNFKICPSPGALERVTVCPDSEDDLEILESNFNMLQSCLLNQIRIVIANQNMVVWVSPSLSINIHATESCLLKQHTEVVISQPENKLKRTNSVASPSTTKKSLITPYKYYITDIKAILSKYEIERTTKPSFMRVTFNAVIDANLKNIFDAKQLFTVYIKDGSSGFKENNVYILRCMESIIEKDLNQENNLISIPKYVFVKIKFFSEFINIKDFDIPVIIPKGLSTILNIDLGRKVILESAPSRPILPETIEITPLVTEDSTVYENLEVNFKTYITSQFSEAEPLLLNSGFIINFSSFKNISCQVILYPETIKYCLLYGNLLRHCKVIVNKDPVQPYDNIFKIQQRIDVEELCRNVECFESIVGKCIDIFKCVVQMKESLSRPNITSNKNHIFITGPPGSGKTMLCSTVVADLGVWYTRIECRSIKGRKDVVEYFQRVFQLCEEHSPSILICDDIESLIPAENEGLSYQDTVFYDTLIYSIRELLYQCEGVQVLITATGLDAVNSGFKITKGQLLFPFQFNIRELSMTERVNLLKCIIHNSMYYTSNIRMETYHHMAVETTGFTVRDLVYYTNQKIYKALKESVLNKTMTLCLESEHSSKRDVIQKENEEINVWETVGGMDHIKETLVEILCWPLKYPGLFPKQPGGILLFGPPGTGKSLLGSCVANFSQLSFIVVKGPELLSKYIGQSEQAVRNLFLKAEKKKPCVLFFDEFDSLAPRRGHDSTGVTDRVVNQLLTQLDGVEGAIKGVTVMAATSRPDLLDGALLRPGRFDTTIHCSMPNTNDRLKILKILSNNLKFSEDVRLEELAEFTEGFTGADLKSILSTAQLQCLEEQLERCTAVESEEVIEVLMTRNHLIEALTNTRPSLSPEQLLYYDRIYARFLNNNLPEENQPIAAQTGARQRATLA